MALKILLAEDEEALSRVYKAAPEHQGYEVDQAFKGQEAVDLAAQNAYQVMIMDIMMPIKTGIEALKEIRSSGDRTHVIMLTAMAEIDDRVTGSFGPRRAGVGSWERHSTFKQRDQVNGPLYA